LGYPALALGDRDGVYGAPRFHEAAQQAGMRGIIGAELTLGAGSTGNPLRSGNRDLGASSAPGARRPAPGFCSLLLLAATRRGYQNLCRLITEAKLRSPKGESRATWEDLEGRTEGLIGLTSNPLTPDPLHHLQRLFPNRLYIEIQRHLDADEERRNRW